MTNKSKTSVCSSVLGSFVVKDFDLEKHPPSAIRSQDHLKLMQLLPPKDFIWIDNKWLCVCTTPTQPSHFRYLYEIGIRHLIFFKRKELRSKLQSISPRLNRIQIRINRNSPLTVQQIDRFIDVVEQANNEKEAVALECQEEDTLQVGVFLACYLIKLRRISHKEAIKRLNFLRPSLIVNTEQRQIIEHYYMFYFRPFQLKL